MNYFVFILGILGIFFGGFVSNGFSQNALETKLMEKFSQDRSLVTLDENLNEIYMLLRSMLSEKEKRKLLKAQRVWLKERDTKVLSSNISLTSFYERRLNDLKTYFLETYKKTLGQVVSAGQSCNPDKSLKALKNCELPLCMAYKAYFMFETDPQKAQNIINELKKRKDLPSSAYGDPIRNPIDGKLETKDQFALIIAFLSACSGCNPPQKCLPCIKETGSIPFWLVSAHPDLLEKLFNHYTNSSRWYVKIINPLTSWDFTHLETLNRFISKISEGRWTIPSYNFPVGGTIYKDVGCHEALRYYELLYTPNIFKTKPLNESLLPLQSWGYLGIWNYKNYEKFLILFKNASEEMKTFYKKIPELEIYEAKAPELLAWYVKYLLPKLSFNAETKPFQILVPQNLTQETIISLTSDFSKEELTEALNIAILKHAPINVVDYLLKKGADPNHLVYYESALMKAVDQVDVLKLLLQKGAKVNVENPFGKTALFYAIQFGSLESIKALVEAGANVNHPLKSLKILKEINDEILPPMPYICEQYSLEHVAQFTPLVYALRYKQSGVIEYLKSKGAHQGKASKEEIQRWVSRLYAPRVIK